MSWIGWALLSGAFFALRDAAIKEAVQEADAVVLVWGLSTVAALVLVPIAAAQGLPPDARPFAWILLAVVVADLSATLLMAKGLETADLSIVTPLVGSTPALTMITSYIILGEEPTLLGAAGVLVIVAGSYLLQLNAREAGLLAPIRVLVADPGSRRILWAILIFSVGAVLTKMGVEATSPLFWAAAAMTGIALALSPVALRRRLPSLANRSTWASLAAAGLFKAGSVAFFLLALKGGLVAYAVAVKRVSGPIGVVVGRFWFGEDNLRQRLAGSLLILAGVVLIALS